MKLSHQKSNGFKKSVGKHVGRDGTLKPKMWWLGDYEEPARKLAEVIVAEWQGLKRQGVDHWTDDALERIETAKNGGKAPAKATVDAPAKRQYTTHQMLDLYRANVLKSDKADSTKNTTHHQTNQLKHILKDIPLATVGAIELRELVDAIFASDLSDASKFNLVKLLRGAMDWCDRHEIWLAPRRFNEFFRCKWKRGGVIRTFDKSELRSLWVAADDDQRLYLALMLNCGFTSIDIARLEYASGRALSHEPEAYEEGVTYVIPSGPWKKREGEKSGWFADWHIAGKRTKTNVFGAFGLWEETAMLLAKRLHVGTAILSDDGQPLLSLSVEGARTDLVGQSLRKLIRKVHTAGGCRKLPVKALRKTGSQFVRDAGGLEMSKIFLRHSAESMAERHYNRGNFGRLGEVLTAVRQGLSEVMG